MFRFRVAAVAALVAFALLSALAVIAQTPAPSETPAPLPTTTPLPPTATPAPTPSVPEVLGLCAEMKWSECFKGFEDYGLWLVLAAAAVVVAAGFVTGLFQKFVEWGKALPDWVSSLLHRKDPTRNYLKAFIAEYNEFKFRGLQSGAKGVPPPKLEEAFIPLRLLMETDSAQPEREARDKASKGDAETLLGRLGEGKQDPTVSLTEAAKQNTKRKLAFIGAAGSGKSTLLQWAGVTAARHGPGSRLRDDQREFIKAIGEKRLTPIFVILRDFSLHCRTKRREPTRAELLNFLPAQFPQKYGLTLDAGFFEKQLRQGCLLVFDGVDELDTKDREPIGKLIESLARDPGDSPHNFFLLTSRPTGYFGSTRVTDFHKAYVQDFNPKQRDGLLSHWCDAIYPGGAGQRKAEELSSRISAIESLRKLARSPLMTTIIALISYELKDLPRQRAKLYEEAVKMLITETYRESEKTRDIEGWGGLETSVRFQRLAYIAFVLQNQPLDRGYRLPADELAEKAIDAFRSEENPKQAALNFIRTVAERGGLLQEQDDLYGFFTHETFRDFLAAYHLALREEEWLKYLAPQLRETRWDELVQLAAGYLALQNQEKANRFVSLLIEQAEKIEKPADRAHVLTLAGLSLAEFPKGSAFPETRERLTPLMLQTLTANPPLVSPQLRRPLGLALAALGDPRFALPLWELPPDGLIGERGCFVPVPAGKFKMGTSPDDVEKLKAQGVDITSDSWNDEKIPHDVELPLYYLSRFPVTNAEYRRFVNDPNYGNSDYWPGEAGLWLNGQLDFEKYVVMYRKEDHEIVRNWLKDRPVQKRKQPFFWDDPQWNADNLPVVGVTWYEAQAYCLWLSDKLKSQLTTGYAVRLPTEAQWEKAARIVGQIANLPYKDAGLWPWGDEWDTDKCNSEESKFGGTAPVGMYPAQRGANGLGIHDLVGNVWEWTSTVWGAKGETPDFAYPYRADDGREDSTATALRVVRGGSWSYNRWHCRAACRVRLGPAYFLTNIGFRAALSPFE